MPSEPASEADNADSARIGEFVDATVLWSIGVGVGVVVVLSALGVDVVEEFQAGIPTITFLMVGFFGFYALRRLDSMESDQRQRDAEQDERLRLATEAELRRYSEQDARLRSIEVQFNASREELQSSAVNYLIESLPQQIEPPLRDLILDDVNGNLKRLGDALSKGSYVFDDGTHFLRGYSSILQNHPSGDCYATSWAKRGYVWPNDDLEQDTRSFVEAGGTFTRIFFVESPTEIYEPFPRSVLERQIDAGVQVYTVDLTDLQDQLKRVFFVSRRAQMAWNIMVDSQFRITTVKVMTQKQQIDRYMDKFDRLRAHQSIRRITREVLEGPQPTVH